MAERNFSMERIVTVGGGTGSPVVNESLLRTGKVEGINAIAAVYDSGGATGRRRLDSRGEEIAYSDAMRILLSLVPPDKKQGEAYQEMSEMFKHRDRGAVLGQDIFNRFSDKQNGFSNIEKKVKAFGIPINGHVLPSSTESGNIVFDTLSGRTYTGEHQLDDQRMSKDMVQGIRIEPEIEAYPDAVDAIAKAEVIFLSSGSLHGSVMANFLPNGMTEAFDASNGKMFVVTNLVSTRNETHDFTPKDYVNVVERYTGRRPDGLIVPEMTRRDFERRHPKTAALYDLEHSYYLGWEDSQLKDVQKDGVAIVKHDATSVVGDQVIRHDPQKFSATLGEILQ